MKHGRLFALVAASALVVAGGTTVALGWPEDEPSATAKFYDPPVAAEPPGDAEPVAEVDNAGDGTPIVAKAAKPARATTRPVSLAPADAKATKSELPQKATESFSMVSVTWTDPKDRPTGGVEVRTKSAKTGEWSGWQALETEESLAPQGAEAEGIRGGTGGLWVGESDGVAARVRNTQGALPQGLQLNLIDPGKGAGAAKPKTTGSGGQGGAVADLPAYRTRAQWGADEKLVKDAPTYGNSVKVEFVHHTAGGNTYDCADSPAILRSILTDQVKNRGWNDIGYNFLVDKCGVLYEGRKGGADRPVIGAHTYGFNTDSSSIAVLGNFMNTGAPDVVKTVIARVAAAKLGQYNLGTVGRSSLELGVSDSNKFPGKKGTLFPFDRISGHRDAVITECPGDVLYGQLNAIRILAGGTDGSIVLRAPAGGVAYSGSYYVKDTVTVNWSTITPEAELTGFEVLVDGKVVQSVGAGVRTAAVKLALGTRKVQVRSLRADGTRPITPATSVISDNKPPVFSPLGVGLRPGTVTTTSVPMKVSWKVVDNTKLSTVRLITPTTVAFGATTTEYAKLTGRPGKALAYQLRAADIPGNSVLTAKLTRAPALLAESSAKKSGTWSTKSNKYYLNGKAYYSTAKNAKLTFTVTGTAAGVIVDKTKSTGTFDIYVDGKKKVSINTKNKSTAYRQMVWATGLVSGKHTVQIVKTGTAGVFIDGLVYLK